MIRTIFRISSAAKWKEHLSPLVFLYSSYDTVSNRRGVSLATSQRIVGRSPTGPDSTDRVGYPTASHFDYLLRRDYPSGYTFAALSSLTGLGYPRITRQVTASCRPWASGNSYKRVKELLQRGRPVNPSPFLENRVAGTRFTLRDKLRGNAVCRYRFNLIENIAVSRYPRELTGVTRSSFSHQTNLWSFYLYILLLMYGTDLFVLALFILCLLKWSIKRK